MHWIDCNILRKTTNHTPRSPFREEILKMDHLDHDSHVLLCSRAQVVFRVALSLELEYHLFDGHAFPTDAAESVPETVGHTLQSILDEGFPLDQNRDISEGPFKSLILAQAALESDSFECFYYKTQVIKSDKKYVYC